MFVGRLQNTAIVLKCGKTVIVQLMKAIWLYGIDSLGYNLISKQWKMSHSYNASP